MMQHCGAKLAVLLAAGVWGVGAFSIARAAQDTPKGEAAESVTFGSGDRISGHIVSISADGFLRMSSPGKEDEAALRVATLQQANFTPTAKEADPHLVLLTNGDFIAGTVSAVTAAQVVIESSAVGKLAIDRSLVMSIRFTADDEPLADAHHETVLLANKDRTPVDNVTLAEGQLNTKTDFGELSLPLARVSGITFRSSGLKKPEANPNAVHVWTGRTTLTLDSVEFLDDKALAGRAAQLGGPVRIERAALKLVIFPGGVFSLDCGKDVSERGAQALPLKVVLIPVGEFKMGCPENEAERGDNEGPQHLVRITKPFCMGAYVVTQAQYEAVTGANPSRFKGESNPVEQVSWNDAVEFCKKLSGKTGLTVRLPTEAEWEYACRAGTTTPFNTGETISTDQANYNGEYTYGNGRKGEVREKTVAVGSFKPNAWGLYDMHGNVWEWCRDLYGQYQAGEAVDPVGPKIGESRVLRGGSWLFGPWPCRSASRGRFVQEGRDVGIGFRVVCAPRP